MKPNDFLQAVNDELRGTDEAAPTADTTEGAYWLRTADRIRRSLYADATKQFASTYTLLELGDVSASDNPEFSLAADFIGDAENCYAKNDAGKTWTFDIVRPQNARIGSHDAIITESNPRLLKLMKPILDGDSIVGAQMYLPAYVQPAGITAKTRLITCEDINWLVLETASKIAFNSIVYEDKAADLHAQAAPLYKNIVRNNRRANASAPNASKTRVRNRIRAPRYGR